MKPEEANRIIAEYMGYTVYPDEAEFIPQGLMHVKEYALAYDNSLDSLVPVWNKIYEKSYYNITITSDSMDAWLFYWDYLSTQKVMYESPLRQPLSKAACIATAMVINHLNTTTSSSK